MAPPNYPSRMPRPPITAAVIMGGRAGQPGSDTAGCTGRAE